MNVYVVVFFVLLRYALQGVLTMKFKQVLLSLKPYFKILYEGLVWESNGIVKDLKLRKLIHKFSSVSLKIHLNTGIIVIRIRILNPKLLVQCATTL